MRTILLTEETGRNDQITLVFNLFEELRHMATVPR